ncbi:MAG: hypothetical protein AAFY65_07845 [Pseudomonadota bacterium]
MKAWPGAKRCNAAATSSGHAFTVPDVLFAKITDAQREGWAEDFAGTR